MAYEGFQELDVSRELLLSALVCTRNRFGDLIKCVRSLIEAAEFAELTHKMEIVVIDDGALTEDMISQIRNLSRDARLKIRYYRKNKPGLYASRKMGIELAKGRIMFFLDDDVELERDFLEHVLVPFEDADVGGVCGLDILLRKPSLRLRAYQRIFLHSRRNCGSLSVTGFNGGIARWPTQTEPFFVDFFSGCNMLFLKQLLLDLPATDWFNSYSIGEDLFISHFVALKSTLIVVPAARLRHYLSSQSRDSEYEIAKTLVWNHYYILRTFYNSRGLLVLFLWSITGFAVKEIYDMLIRLLKCQPAHLPRVLNTIHGMICGVFSLPRLGQILPVLH